MKKILFHDIYAYCDANGNAHPHPGKMIKQTRTVEALFCVTKKASSCSEEAIVEELQYWTNDTKSVADIHHFLIAKIKLPREGEF